MARMARALASALRHARYRSEAAVFDLLTAVVVRLSPAARQRTATLLGLVVWAVDGRHRRVAAANLRLAYGETLTPAQRGRLVRESMRHLVRVALETFAVRTYLSDPSEVPVVVQGAEHLRKAAASGRGVILATGHLGHWELLGIVCGRLGFPGTAITRPLDNPYLEARLLDQRTLSGNRVIDKHGAFDAARRVLLDGGILGMLFDQRPKRGGIPVPFFGAPAYVTDGLARLVLDTDADVMPCFGVFESDGTVRVTFEGPIPIVRTGDRMADAIRMSADCTAVIEQWVRRYPGQWLWTHRRWARPAPGEPRLAPPEDGRES